MGLGVGRALGLPSGLGGSAHHPKCSNNLVVPTCFRSLPGPLVSLTLTPTGTTEPSPGPASPWGSESEPQEAWTHLFLCALGMGAAAVSDPGAVDLAVCCPEAEWVMAPGSRDLSVCLCCLLRFCHSA